MGIPNDRPPIGLPAPPVHAVRRPPWSVATATYPTAIDSPRFSRGAYGPEGVDRVSFGIDMLIVPVCLQWRTEEMTVRLSRTKLSLANYSHDVELLDTALSSPYTLPHTSSRQSDAVQSG